MGEESENESEKSENDESGYIFGETLEVRVRIDEGNATNV